MRFRPGANATYPVVVAAKGCRQIVASIEVTPADPDVITLRPVQPQRQ